MFFCDSVSDAKGAAEKQDMASHTATDATDVVEACRGWSPSGGAEQLRQVTRAAVSTWSAIATAW